MIPYEHKKQCAIFHYRDKGEKNPKFGVLGFVSENKHSEDATYAAANYHIQKKSILRNSPPVFYGLLLVNAHCHQGNYVYYGPIYYQKIHKSIIA